MTQPVKDSLLDLERHRQRLEDNVEKLRKSLQHWQTWEADYEGLREEILAAKPKPDIQYLAALVRAYKGELLDAKEVEEILGPTNPRITDQVLNILERRVDYVQQNVRTIEKQLEDAENRAAAATVVSNPDAVGEDGLPVIEIIEELDEDDNIIASHTSTPGNTKAQLLEVLEKAGVKGPAESAAVEAEDMTKESDPTRTAAELHKDNNASKNALSPPVKSSHEVKAGDNNRHPPNRFPARGHEESNVSPEASPKKKGVSFAADTRQGPERAMSRTAKRVDELMEIAQQQDEPSPESPIIPANESAEDADLRKEMLDYAMSEVGAVVAELQLEEGNDRSDEGEDDDEDDIESSSDGEDEYGRSKGSLVDDVYRQQMKEVQERLSLHMQNIGKDPESLNRAGEGVGVIKVNDQVATSSTPDAGPSKVRDIYKKGVRFSEHLDISPDAQAGEAVDAVVAKQKPRTTAPVNDIVERIAPSPASSDASIRPKKKSRFRSEISSSPSDTGTSNTLDDASQTRPSAPRTSISTLLPFSHISDPTRTVPTGPLGKTLAPEVIERDVRPDTSIDEPDDLDPQLIYQEVAAEYNRRRNMKIQQEGGFRKEEEDQIMMTVGPGGRERKFSRFMAARLGRF